MSRQYFLKEFNTFNYILHKAKNVLIIGHSNPDADAVGSVVSLGDFIQRNYNANVTLGCYDVFPETLQKIIPGKVFENPDNLDLGMFDVVVGCDSVDRGFNKVIQNISKECVTVVFDHHHDTITRADLFMNDENYSSTCEILYNFFKFTHKEIDRDIANALLAGIIFDTGTFRHANTSADTLATASDLVKKGASIAKINKALFSNRNVETLNLWGRVLEKTKFYKSSGLAVAAISKDDLQGHFINSSEFSNIASMLTTVPDVKVAIVVYQADDTTIKGSLRAEKQGNIDVSAIAHTLGGGGHKLASGFAISGTIKSLPDGGWSII